MELPNRKHLRLQDYDYNQGGLYFITACIKDRQELLGKVVSPGDAVPYMELSDLGKIVDIALAEISTHYDNVIVDDYVVMPNHIHVLLFLTTSMLDTPDRTKALVSGVITALKRVTNKAAGTNLWQTSFHDHIIRDERGYLDTRHYIDVNPQKWAEDVYHPQEKLA